MKKLLFLLSFAPLTANLCSVTTLKADESNFYISGSGGIGFLNQAESEKKDYSVDGTTVSIGWELDLEDKFGYDIGIGYDLGKTRIEFNVNQQNTNVERTSVDATYSGTSAIVGVSTNGDADATSYLISINRDFPSDAGWVPYLGAGIGMSNITTKDVTLNTGTLGDALNVDLGTSTILKGDSTTVLSYQLRGGIAKEISKKTDIFGEVSYLGTEGNTAGSGDTEIKWKGINVIGTKIGFRYKF